MLWTILNWRTATKLLPILGVLGLCILVGGLYLWGDHQRDARAEAEAIAKDAVATAQHAEKLIEQANREMDKIRAQVAETERIMAQREQEKESTREALRAASWTISQLRRDNAQLREWLDRPIPADIYRLLDTATRGRDQGDKARPTRATASGLQGTDPKR